MAELDDVLKDVETPVTGSFPKFQYSIMYGDGEQLVIRTDNFEDLKKQKGLVDTIIAARAERAAQTPPAQQTPYNAPRALTQQCPIHGVLMNSREGSYGVFYSHDLGDAYCNGKKITPKKR